MKSQFSLTGLSTAVLMFAGTVAMHQAAKAEDVFTGPLAPVVNSLAPLANELLSEEIEEDFEGKHHGKHGKNGKNHGKHGKKGKHHDENEGLSTLEGPEDITTVF
jgi:hypothetical protein